MDNYLMRDGAPFGEEGWEKVDDMVVTVMKKNLEGRRFIELVGPLGWGVEMAPAFGFVQEDGADVATETTEYLRLQEIAQEFTLRAKHMAMADDTPFALDLGAVALAATRLADAEEDIVIGGLREAAEISIELVDWDTMGGPFKVISKATAELRGSGFDAPYAAVMHPNMYARMAGLMQHGRREVDMVERLVEAGLYQSTTMAESEVLVVSPYPWNVDLVVGQDAVTAYLGNEGIDHRFRIFETLALRIKRSGAICVIE
ncbi:MAG: family 1 encapsulin nanocompartment shell protein [Anaerolineales bacterium]